MTFLCISFFFFDKWFFCVYSFGNPEHILPVYIYHNQCIDGYYSNFASKWFSNPESLTKYGYAFYSLITNFNIWKLSTRIFNYMYLFPILLELDVTLLSIGALTRLYAGVATRSSECQWKVLSRARELFGLVIVTGETHLFETSKYNFPFRTKNYF